MKKYLAELVGTFTLVLFGCGSAAIAGAKLGTLGIALAFGLSIVAMAYAIGDVSGCHVNPAVSFAMLLTKRMSGKDFVGYVIAQVIGALAASALLAFVFDIQAQRAAARRHRLLHIARGHHSADFIAPQVDPADGLEHFNALHAPANGGFPQNGLEHGAGGGRRHHVIRHALHLHFWAGKAGEGACDFKAKAG